VIELETIIEPFSPRGSAPGRFREAALAALALLQTAPARRQ